MALRLKDSDCCPVQFHDYQLYVTDKAKNFFYKNRLNILGIPQRKIVKFLNNGISAHCFRFIPRRKFTETTLRQTIEKSLDSGLPVIIRVGENFRRLTCTIRYDNSTTRKSAIRWHYITAVGIEADTLIFYTWGRKGEMKLSDLYRHFGFTGGIIAAE